MTEMLEHKPQQDRYMTDGLDERGLASLARFEVSSSHEASQREEHENICRQLGRVSVNSLSRVIAPEFDQYDLMAIEMKQKIIGQDDAIDAMVEALSGTELQDEKGPICSFLLLGPTGVGKTETAKALNRYLHDDTSNILRIDCSDYAAPHTVATLTGSPPGYVGREQEPGLSQKKVEGKKRVILFDELEKGAYELHTLLLQILEEGELTMKDGSVVSFRDAIVIMTSNLGARQMQHELSDHKAGFRIDNSGNAPVDRGALKEIAMNEVKKYLMPEFLNRIDSQIAFMPLDDEQLTEVLGAYVERRNDSFYEKGIELAVSEDLRRAIVKDAPDRREYGGRHVVKVFKRKVLNRLSRLVESGSIERGSKVYALLSDDMQTAANSLNYELLTEPSEKLKQAYVEAQVNSLAPGTEVAASLAALERLKTRMRDEDDDLDDDSDDR